MALAKTEFFLGGITQNGFHTHFDNEISNEQYFTYILKGGAGTGKSTLLKKIAKEFCEIDDVCIYYCSSDPNSLDAVILKKAKVIIVDGTAPHTFDPVYPGVSQIILNLGEFWDGETLIKNYIDIVNTINENLKWHKRCKNYVNALASLFTDTYSIAHEALNYKKLDGFVSRLSNKLLPKKALKEGETEFAQLSALTPKGYYSLLDTVKEYENIYILNDNYFAGSDIFLRDFANIATSKGLDVIISECTLFSPHIYEHLLIPALKTAFISSNPINNNTIDNAKPINYLRFYNSSQISQKKQRLAFNKKACDDLLEEAVSVLNNANVIHRKIEDYYILAMDFDKVEQLTQKLIKQIKNKYSNN